MTGLTDLIELVTGGVTQLKELTVVDGQLERELFTTRYSVGGGIRQLERLTEAVRRVQTLTLVREQSARARERAERAARLTPAASPALDGGNDTYGASLREFERGGYRAAPDMEGISRFFERDSRRYAGEFELYR